MALFSLGLFVGFVFAVLFAWLRLASRIPRTVWWRFFFGIMLVCVFFVVCFAVGVWFSIARLKGEGWILSA